MSRAFRFNGKPSACYREIFVVLHEKPGITFIFCKYGISE